MYNLIFLYYGLLGILTQLVIFRELAVLFYGSELFLGTFLSSWLFWAGLGSLFARRLIKKEQDIQKYFSYGFLAIALLFPAISLLIRASKSAFAFGEFIGPLGTVLYTFSVMSALCFTLGAEFSLACAVASAKKEKAALARVYLFESLGAVIGGVLFTYVLLGSVPLFLITLVLSLGCLLISRRPLIIMFGLALLCAALRLEPLINKLEWKGYQFIAQKETRNETLSLVNLGSIKNVFVDGMLSASFPSPESYEPMTHWPLLAKSEPEKVLLLGDTSLGLLKEVLKHNPKQIDYVVLDKSFLNIVEPYLESEDILALKHPAARIHYADSRSFVNKSKDKYDVVIINIQEVPNLKTNRFFTREFYSRINSILKADGILALGIVSSENYTGPQARLFNASVYRTLSSVFKTVEVIPGDTLILLSSPSDINLQKEVILERFSERGISNRYFIPSYIEYKLEVSRRNKLKELLEENTGVGLNRDFKPTTCYYFAGFWLNKFVSPLALLVGSLALIAIVFSAFKKRRVLFSLSKRREVVLIFVLGFIGMLLELVLLLGYQIISGYVYWQMGLFFAAFMLGLFLGAFLANQFKSKSRRSYFIHLSALTTAIVILSVCAAYLLPRLIYLSVGQAIFIFAGLLGLIGVMVGDAFVIAGFLASENEVMAKAGSLYAADLWGASLGALLATNFIAPLLGIVGALNFSALFGLAGLTLFLSVPEKAKL